MNEAKALIAACASPQAGDHLVPSVKTLHERCKGSAYVPFGLRGEELFEPGAVTNGGVRLFRPACGRKLGPTNPRQRRTTVFRHEPGVDAPAGGERPASAGESGADGRLRHGSLPAVRPLKTIHGWQFPQVRHRDI